MRLICPNCGAQYEVDASMIPDEGRDVQCSSCGQTWFQPPEGEAPFVLSDPDLPDSDTAPTEDETAAHDASGDTEAAPEHLDDTDPDEPAEEVANAERTEAVGPAPPPPDESFVAADDDRPEAPHEPTTEEIVEAINPDTSSEEDLAYQDYTPQDEAATTEPAEEDGVFGELPPRPSERLDENILGILREEAEREAEARRNDAASDLETQPDLGLEGSVASTRPGVSAHMARMRGAVHEDDDDTQGAGARSDLLPDIEEINSSLRPASEHPETAEVADPVVVEAKQKRGFRTGFTIMIVIAALLVLAYVFAPQISEQVPALDPYIARYVEGANSIRDGAEGLMERSIDSLSGGGDDAGQ